MNPYTVLGIHKDASNREIILAATLEMRKKQWSAKEIAQAQKMLLDPVSRSSREFLHWIDFDGIKERLLHTLEETASPEKANCASPDFDAPCLTLFDDDPHGL